jgi:heptosyltransferase-2
MQTKFLVIQTAFLGDVILALPVVQALRAAVPDAEIAMLVRSEAAGLTANHPAVNRVWTLDKKANKIRQLFSLLTHIRNQKYDYIINLHRFASSGFLTVFGSAKQTRGFRNNPFSFLYTKAFVHRLDGRHEVERNLSLITDWANTVTFSKRPILYPAAADWQAVAHYVAAKPYVVIAPASIWYTKQWHLSGWQTLLENLPSDFTIYLIGGASDTDYCQHLTAFHAKAVNLAGKLSLLQSAALMQAAARVIVNDSAPLHLASAVNAPTTAIFCSTVPSFGFGPLADDAVVIEVNEKLACRPCGLHGHKACPRQHFRCATQIEVGRIIATIQ